MIGTVFLWMYWPSFNAALAGSDFTQHRAVVNTVLSLSGSCFSAFLASYYFRKSREFCMVDIQNATLAGGVALGTTCDLMIGPGAALLIGCLAGVLSVIGYCHVQPALENSIGYLDTCGVNNLHGMPSILGAIAGVVACATIGPEQYGFNKDFIGTEGYQSQMSDIYEEVSKGRSLQDQTLYQLGFMFLTLVLSLAGGAFTGVVIKMSCLAPGLEEGEQAFQDSPYWEVPDIEVPYYFDHRGEVLSHGDNSAAGGQVTSDANVAEKLKQMQSNMTELKQRVNRRKQSIVNVTNPYGPPPVYHQMPPTTSDPELKLLVARLINKVDDQTIDHRNQMNRMMHKLATATSNGNAKHVEKVDDKNPNSPSASLKYIY